MIKLAVWLVEQFEQCQSFAAPWCLSRLVKQQTLYVDVRWSRKTPTLPFF